MPVPRAYRVGPIQVLQKCTVNGMNALQSPETNVPPPLTSLTRPSLPGKFEVLATSREDALCYGEFHYRGGREKLEVRRQKQKLCV